MGLRLGSRLKSLARCKFLVGMFTVDLRELFLESQAWVFEILRALCSG